MKGFSPKPVSLLIVSIIFLRLCYATDYFMIKVIDSETRRGIPLVELKTMNNISYFTDSNGFIAFFEPGLMNQQIYFNINGQGYEYPQDSFGYRGTALLPVIGDSVLIELKRTNIAERLYRSTGAGIYRDSYLLGKPLPIKNPLLNGKVLGQDSNLSLVYKNKIFWIWGDTFQPAYPLGNFSVSAATSELPAKGGLHPNEGIDYTYFNDANGFSKKMIDIAGQGFVWFDWLMILKDSNGNEKLVSKYARVKPNFDNYERGIAIFNEQLQHFEKYKTVDEWIPYYHVNNHPFLAESPAGKYYYLTSEFTFNRIEPDLDKVSNPSAYQAFSCLKQGQKFDKNNLQVERDKDGRLAWAWKKGTDAIGVMEQQKLIEAGLIKKEEGWLHLRDFYSGNPIVTNRNSISWNPYRKKWILIAGVKVGEIWYSEADTPIGPWIYAKKVLKHDKFFYNPVQHVFFDEEEGKTIYFEATYTNSFLAEKNLTPRYEYNQLMYKLSLDKRALFMPQPLYKTKSTGRGSSYKFGKDIDHLKEKIEKVSFLAFSPARKYSTLIPIYSDGQSLTKKVNEENEILFYALPAAENEGIDGKWDITLTDNVFYTQNFKIKIASSVKKIDVQIEQTGLSLIASNWKKKEFSLSFSYFGEVFEMKGSLNAGKITGTWSSADNTKSGTWQAICYDPDWQSIYSASVVPLYEFFDTKNSLKYYSTSREAISDLYTRSKLPICRVWKNPAQKLFYDFSIKWIAQN